MGDHRAIAWVFAGGDPPDPYDVRDFDEPALVIAADSGLRHALGLGISVDVVVGDLDSVTDDALASAVAAGALVERHPTAKDATDLELALAAAHERACTHAVVVGIGGGRLDHFVANTLALAAPELAPMTIEARIGGATVAVVREHAQISGLRGDVVTLLPVGGAALGVVTEGLRYPLRHETLRPGSTRGVSNELLDSLAHVSLDDGVLLVVRPDPRKDQT